MKDTVVFRECAEQSGPREATVNVLHARKEAKKELQLTLGQQRDWGADPCAIKNSHNF